MERVLNQLVDKLRKAYQDRLVSVTLYGSAAVGDHHGRFSDINVFCVLKEITPRELSDGEPVLRWWRQLGNPSPLLLSEREVEASTDCFPIEFHDIKARHRVLFGQDVVASLEVDYCFYRAQVEHELRAKLLRLRQKAAGVLSEKDLLLRLLLDSLSTFCVLFRHALRLAGGEEAWAKREVVALAREKFGLAAAPFETLLDLREGKRKPREVEPRALLEEYLREIHVVIDAVDRLER